MNPAPDLALKRPMSPQPSTAQPPLLEVRDFGLEFRTRSGTVRALQGVNLQLRKGEIVALVGESGSGKSVSALSILKLLPYPSASHPSGSIRFKGAELLDADERDLMKVRGNDITMIFQEPMTSLNPTLTIGRQLSESLELHLRLARSEARDRVRAMLQAVGISDPERRLAAYPHELSGGMRQRVMVASALSCSPRLLLADEPTTALDVTTQAQILELIESLAARSGTAVLLITHDLGLVARHAKRVNVM